MLVLVLVFAAACWGGSAYSLSSLWGARPDLNTKNVPVEPPARRPHSAADRAELTRRGFRLTAGSAAGVTRVLQVVQALGMERDWVVVVRQALLAFELGREDGHSAVEVLAASQRPDVGVQGENEPPVAELDAAGLRAWAEAAAGLVGGLWNLAEVASQAGVIAPGGAQTPGGAGAGSRPGQADAPDPGTVRPRLDAG